MAPYKSVLIVDDDPTQIAIVRAYLSGLGVTRIHSASDGTAGLDKLADHLGEIDLVVSDLQMPRMDGLEFLRYLKTLGYSGKLAIFSGVGKSLLEHAGRLAKMHDLNFIGTLEKPLSKEILDSVFLRSVEEAPAVSPRRPEIITQEDFSTALDNGLIKPYYQPKIEIATGKIIGAESLARWEKPCGEIVLPAQFVEFAEANGRIEDLTYCLFNQVIKDAAVFYRLDPDHTFAVNLSPRMLNNIYLPDRLESLTKQAGLPPKNIRLEITENSILNLDATTLEIMSRMRIHDFEIAIDDFGTGSSNINSLRDFPYCELKVDQSFIRNAQNDAFSARTIGAAVSFAKHMNMRTVAEGVETEDELAFVESAGIDQIQGFIVSRALPAMDYLGFLESNQGGWQPVARLSNSA